MTSVFADATFYIALGNRRDQLHAAATLLSQSHEHRVVTTEYVLLEVANYLSSPPLRSGFWVLIQQLLADPRTEVVPSSKELWAQGLEFYGRRPDKDWSLTDCISFVVMHERGLTEALTADRHFEQAGFMILLK